MLFYYDITYIIIIIIIIIYLDKKLFNFNLLYVS